MYRVIAVAVAILATFAIPAIAAPGKRALPVQAQAMEWGGDSSTYDRQSFYPGGGTGTSPSYAPGGGTGGSPKLLKHYGYASASSTIGARRPADCPPGLWCGCWLWKHLGISPEVAQSMGLNKASQWKKYGSPSVARVGAIGVTNRHVGIVVADHGDTVTMLSGNHGNMVDTGTYSKRRLTFRS